MKVNFGSDGYIKIRAEDDVESYALRKWIEANSKGSVLLENASLYFEYKNSYGVGINWEPIIEKGKPIVDCSEEETGEEDKTGNKWYTGVDIFRDFKKMKLSDDEISEGNRIAEESAKVFNEGIVAIIEKRKDLIKIENYLKKPYSWVFVPQEEGIFFAEILEFSGCFSQGETIDEAYSNLKEAAISWLMACIARGISIPDPMEVGEVEKMKRRLEKTNQCGLAISHGMKCPAWKNEDESVFSRENLDTEVVDGLEEIEE